VLVLVEVPCWSAILQFAQGIFEQPHLSHTSFCLCLTTDKLT
jgi:hypothetical protein